MLTRSNAREMLIDHLVRQDIDEFRVLTDRDMLEVILHILLDQRRVDDLNKSGPQA